MKTITIFLTCLLSIVALTANIEQSLVGADSLRIGSRFELIIKADRDLMQAFVPDTLKSFEVIKQQKFKSDANSSGLKLEIIPLALGALSFPELTIHAADGSVFSTDRFRVHVLNTRAEGDTLLRDIKPPRHYHGEADFRIYMALIALAVLLLLFLAFRMIKPKAKITEPISEVPALPAWKQALMALAELQKSDLLERHAYAEYHYRLSVILRGYLEAVYGFSAAEMTTYEIRIFLRETQEKLKDESGIIEFLKACDMVKFAKRTPEAEEIKALVDWLQNYLIQDPQEVKDAAAL